MRKKDIKIAHKKCVGHFYVENLVRFTVPVKHKKTLKPL